MGFKSATEAPGYTTNLGRSRGFAGWGVKCDGHLALGFNETGEQDTVPYRTSEEAEARRDLIEGHVLGCGLPHTIVRVYHTRSGRRPKDD